MTGVVPMLATLRGETFGIGATEGVKGADVAALVMLALFLFLLSLILLVARSLAKRAANPSPEQVLLQDIAADNPVGTGLTGPPSGNPWRQHGDAPSDSTADDGATEAGRDPWEKPDDWWRKMPQ